MVNPEIRKVVQSWTAVDAGERWYRYFVNSRPQPITAKACYANRYANPSNRAWTCLDTALPQSSILRPKRTAVDASGQREAGL
jgi:hypothetical protein